MPPTAHLSSPALTTNQHRHLTEPRWRMTVSDSLQRRQDLPDASGRLWVSWQNAAGRKACEPNEGAPQDPTSSAEVTTNSPRCDWPSCSEKLSARLLHGSDMPGKRQSRSLRQERQSKDGLMELISGRRTVGPRRVELGEIFGNSDR